jgi:isocitrate dehydrogenase kinase/phosphatase
MYGMENSHTHPEYEQFKHMCVMAEAQAEQAQAQAEQAQIQNRLTLTVEQLAISLGGLRAEVGEVAKIQWELAESQAHTEDRLNALFNYFERHLNEHDQ